MKQGGHYLHDTGSKQYHQSRCDYGNGDQEGYPEQFPSSPAAPGGGCMNSPTSEWGYAAKATRILWLCPVSLGVGLAMNFYRSS